MTNSAFWEAYKAKCLEKGLPPRYENAEEFAKAMTEPPKPYSTDDFTLRKDESIQNNDEFEHMHYLMEQSCGFVEEEYLDDAKESPEETAEPIVCVSCQEPKSPDAFGTLRNGDLRKICRACHGKKISAARCKTKEMESTSEVPVVQKDHSAQVKARKDLNGAMHSNVGDDKVAIMKLSIFHAALGMAYERGIAEGKTFADMTITEVELPVILDEVLGARA